MLVKICGVRSAKDAQIALDAGADIIGMILVPDRGRTVDTETAKAISKVVHEYKRENTHPTTDSVNYFAGQANQLRALASKPLLVGVFMNQTLAEIKQKMQEIWIDVVQLHGKEPLRFARELGVPVIKRFTPGNEQYDEWNSEGYHSGILIDGETGGKGELVNWDLLHDISSTGAQFILGGGITPENVASAATVKGVFMVDVSSGVEETEGENKGFKSREKVEKFVSLAKGSVSA